MVLNLNTHIQYKNIMDDIPLDNSVSAGAEAGAGDARAEDETSFSILPGSLPGTEPLGAVGAEADAGDERAEDETSFINQADDTWEVPDATPSWADSSVPSGISQEDLADKQQTEALVNRWRRERGEVQANLEFASSTKSDLWLRWGSRWLLLTHKNSPGEFLKPSSLKKYRVDVTKALGVYKSTGLPHQAVAALSRANQELGEVAGSIDTVELRDLGQTITKAEAAVQIMGTTFTVPEQPGVLPITQREFLGVCRALETIRGKHINNLAKLTELDKHIALERRKLNEAGDDIDEATKRRINERLRSLMDERATRGALRSQISRIRETIDRLLHEDKTLAERIRTLFRAQGVTIGSIIAAIGMTISTLILPLTGGSGGDAVPTPTPPQPPAGKGGAREWIKKHLRSLGRALVKLAGKAAAALPGIIGSIVSWILSLLGKTVGWLAENLWAVLLAVGGLLLVAAREWLLPKKPKQA